MPRACTLTHGQAEVETVSWILMKRPSTIVCNRAYSLPLWALRVLWLKHNGTEFSEDSKTCRQVKVIQLSKTKTTTWKYIRCKPGSFETEFQLTSVSVQGRVCLSECDTLQKGLLCLYSRILNWGSDVSLSLCESGKTAVAISVMMYYSHCHVSSTDPEALSSYFIVSFPCTFI